MALTLIKENGTGLANANAYATAADGDAYHEGHLYATAWTLASTGNKEAALVMATRLIDAYMDFGGKKTTSGQALQWPRSGCVNPDEPRTRSSLVGWGRSGTFDSGAVPAVVLAATCEMARELLISDRTRPPLGEGLKSTRTAGDRSPAELIVDGEFAGALANPPWSWEPLSATAFVAGGVSGNCAQVSNYDDSPGYLAQSFATEAGRVYKLQVYFKKGTSDGGIIMVGTSLDPAGNQDWNIHGSVTHTDAVWTLKTVYFATVRSTTWVKLRNSDLAAPKYSLWDGLSVQAVYDPFSNSNFMNGDLSVNGLVGTTLVFDRIGQAPVISRVALALLAKVGTYRGERGSVVALQRT
jgi:hypothetical protein